MKRNFDNEEFANTLNTLGIWQSMVDQMLYQQIYGFENCPYYEHVAQKMMDLKVALIAMNTIYASEYEQYKETQTNG